MLKIIPNKKNIGAEIIVNLRDISNKEILQIKKALNKISNINKERYLIHYKFT